MTPLGWTVIAISVIVGGAMGYYLYDKFPNLINKTLNKDKKINEVINNPYLLAEKLNAHGKIYEEGENGMRAEIDIKVGVNQEGEEVLTVEKIESKKKEIKKKVKEDKTKKKVKKKKVKKVKKNKPNN